MNTLEEALLLTKWRNDPNSFYEDIYQFEIPRNGPHYEVLDDIANLDYRYFVASATRGGGKTNRMAGIALWHTIVLSKFIKQPFRISILSGSLAQSRTLHEHVSTARLKSEYIKDQIDGEPTQTLTKFKDGSWIKAFPASERTVLSTHCEGLIIDEAAIKVLADGKLINKAIPLISTSQWHRLWLCSTPYEYMSYFVDILENKDNKYSQYKRYIWGSMDCPWISEELRIAAKRELSEEDYAIHWEGKPMPLSSTMFSQYDLKNFCRLTSKPQIEYEDRIYWGIDWGFDHPTVLAIIQIDQMGFVTVLKTYEWRKKRYDKIQKELTNIGEAYPPREVRVDSSHIGENQRLKSENPFKVREIVFKRDKDRIMANLKNLIEKHEFFIWEEETEALYQLAHYTESTTKDDDYVDAIALASLRDRIPRPDDFSYAIVKRGNVETPHPERDYNPPKDPYDKDSDIDFLFF